MCVLWLGASGTDGAPRRMTIHYGAEPVTWLQLGDLDADGDAEVVVGGPAFVKVYGLRQRRPR